MNTIRRTLAGTVAASALVLGVAGAASAELVTVSDPADTAGSQSDMRDVTVKHSAGKVVTIVEFTELAPTSDAGPSSLSIFIDTDRTAKGPEFRIGTGLQEGTDYQLVRMEGWKPVGEPLTCDHQVRLNFKADHLKAKVARACLGTPDEIRVAVKMTDAYDASHVLVDWMKKPRGFTTWLATA
jgi:hypothetical protein